MLGTSCEPRAIIRTSDSALTLTSSSSLVTFTAKEMLSNGTLRISGMANLAIWASCLRVYSLKQVPGCVRPARPRRCLASARVTHVSTNRDKPVSPSYCVCLTLPASTTKITSSMVMDVSATLVDAMIFQRDVFLKTCRCSSLERLACKGRISAGALLGRDLRTASMA